MDRTRGTILVIFLFAILSYARVWLIQDVIWDDNAWLLATYATDGLRQFLDTGFVEGRRVPLGAFLYVLFQSHYLSDYFYVAWHAIDTITQIGTPTLFYFILRKQFPENRLFALSATISFIVFPLDYTIGYASGASYRLGFLFFMVSLYATQHSFSNARLHPLPLTAAIVTGAISYVFFEAAIALEPARALIILYQLRQAGFRQSDLLKRLVFRYAPFVPMGLLLVVYKLTFKPFGIYEGIYNFDPLFLFRGWNIVKSISHFLFSQWLLISKSLDTVATTSILLGLLGTILALKQYRYVASTPVLDSSHQLIKAEYAAPVAIISLGLTFLIPPVIMVHAFSRPISWGMSSSHAIPAQIGYAIILGWLIHRMHVHACVRRWLWPRAALGAFIGLGVFFNNANIDMYLTSWKSQIEFWQAFRERFPSLPEGATFFFDVRNDALYSDLRDYYGLEYQLNLLYATSRTPSEFRRYKAYTADELTQTRGKTSRDLIESGVIERTTHLGHDRLRPSEFIVVHYRDAILRVNNEILKCCPNVSYRAWLDKNPPGFEKQTESYVFRSRMVDPTAQKSIQNPVHNAK